MENYKTYLGVLGIIVGFAGYAPYVRDVFTGKTKPHAFSWLAWSVLEWTAFFAQLSKHAGAGAWITGLSAMVGLLVACVALYRKETEIHVFDWVALCGAIIGIILWTLTNNPLLAVILVTISDALAFIPTFRKSFYKPDQETLIEYAFSAVKWMIAIFALQTISLTTWLFPASLIFTNGSFVIMSLIRRKILSKKLTHNSF